MVTLLEELQEPYITHRPVSLGVLCCEAAAEIERLTRERDEARELVLDIVACTHRPNLTDRTRIDIAPGKHRLFQAAIERAIDGQFEEKK